LSQLPAAISGLLASLPAEGNGWTQPKRDSFMATFGAVLDFCFPILAHEPDEDEDATDEGKSSPTLLKPH
jgi:hypothetical protein